MTLPSDEPVRIYGSRWKLGGLALPCFLAAASGLYGLVTAGLGRGAIVDLALLLVGGLCGLVMLQMALDREPVLEIDAQGITCRRPPVGLLPWAAVAGLGLGRAPMRRTVLLIAVDQAQAGPELRERVRQHRAAGLVRPTAGRFQGELRRDSTIQVPISMLAVTARELQALLRDRVHMASA